MFKFGELVVSKNDIVLEKMFGEKVLVPKGNKVVIGFDGFAHHLRDGAIQPLGEPANGYSSTGIVEVIMLFLNERFPLEDMLDDYDETAHDFRQVIKDALEEIGIYDGEETED